MVETKTKNGVCPKCKSNNVYSSDAGEYDTDSAYSPFSCEDCGADYQVHYETVYTIYHED